MPIQNSYVGWNGIPSRIFSTLYIWMHTWVNEQGLSECTCTLFIGVHMWLNEHCWSLSAHMGQLTPFHVHERVISSQHLTW